MRVTNGQDLVFTMETSEGGTMVHSVEPKKSTLNDKGGKHVNREVAESIGTPPPPPKAFYFVSKSSCDIDHGEGIPMGWYMCEIYMLNPRILTEIS